MSKTVTYTLGKNTINELPLLLILITISSFTILIHAKNLIIKLYRSLDTEDETFGDVNINISLIFSFVDLLISALPIMFYLSTKFFIDNAALGIIPPIVLTLIMTAYTIFLLLKLILERI